MNIRRLIVIAVSLMTVALSIDGDIGILSRALDVVWFNPAADAQDALSDQESLSTDPARDVQRAVLPTQDDGERHVVNTALTKARIACASCLARSPPSA